MSKTSKKFSPEVRDRAVRMVGEHGLITARSGKRLLEREVKELRRANEILRKDDDSQRTDAAALTSQGSILRAAGSMRS